MKTEDLVSIPIFPTFRTAHAALHGKLFMFFFQSMD